MTHPLSGPPQPTTPRPAGVGHRPRLRPPRPPIARPPRSIACSGFRRAFQRRISRFGRLVADGRDFPTGLLPASLVGTNQEVQDHVIKLLKARKGSNGGYAALLIAECTGRAELPTSLADFLIAIDADLPKSGLSSAGPTTDAT